MDKLISIHEKLSTHGLNFSLNGRSSIDFSS